MDDPWRPAPSRVAISPGEVHLWRIALDPPDATVARLRTTLDRDEQARADRFRAERLGSRFTVGRGALRSILAGCLGVEAGEVRFVYGTHGKPALASQGDGPDRIEFNLAHTENLALCAVTLGRAVGVDVESIRPLVDGERIITRFFSEAEQAEFLSLPGPERRNAFFRGWSRKEAFLKATGTGISAGLDTFDVSLGPSTPALLRVGDDPQEAGRWTLFDLDVGPGFSASAVVEGTAGPLAFWRWEANDPAG